LISPSAIVLRRSTDLTLEVFEEIVWKGRPLSLHPELLDVIAAARAAMTDTLADGRAVYGVNTGMGYLATRRLSREEQRSHQANMLLGRAVGGPPYLARDEARAILLARLAGFLSGHAAVTPELCRFLVDRLNDDFAPAIPRAGAGCAGEIIPLSHAFQTVMGVGYVLLADGAAGGADAALAARSVAPYGPAEKEGIALLAGAPGAVALTASHRRAAALLARQLLVAAACAIDAINAPLSPYDPVVARLARDAIMERVLARLCDLLSGSRRERPSGQAPVSFRVVPQVLAHLERKIGKVEEDVRRALIAVGDSPAFIEDRFVSNGGFHAIDLASGMDVLCIALVQAAELASQHIHRMLDRRFSGLQDQLTPEPGPQSGLISVHKRVVGATNELRRLASPATIGIADTSLGQEDAMTFTFEAADKLRRTESLVRDVIACELLVARQAWALRSTPVAIGLREQYEQLTATVEAVDMDRPLGEDVGALAAMLATGGFS